MVGILVGAYLLLLLVLNFGPSRRMLVGEITDFLARKLQTEVHIGDVQVGLFNRLIVSDVWVKDQQGKMLLEAGRVTAKIELRSLLKDQLSLRTVSLLDAHVGLYRKKADVPYNFQFVVDAFASKTPQEKSKLDLRINSIILRRVSVDHDLLYVGRKVGQFDLAHLSVSDINANVSLKSLTDDRIRLRVRSFAFRERSGLQLDNLCFKLDADRKGAAIDDFEFVMPHSRLEQSNLTATYDATKGWNNVIPTLKVRGALNGARVSTEDFRPFVRLPKGFELTANVSSSFLVVPNKVRFWDFTMMVNGREMALKADATLLRNEKGIFDVTTRVEELRLSDGFLTRNVPFFVADTAWVRRIGRVGDVTLDGTAHYRKGGRAESKLKVRTDVGDLTLDGTFDGRNVRAALALRNGRPALLMRQKGLPERVGLTSDVRLRLDGKKLADAAVTAKVVQLVWNGYAFQPIGLKGRWSGETAEVKVTSADPNVNLSLDGAVRLTGKRVDGLRVTAHVGHLHPAVLGLRSALAERVFQGDLQADVKHVGSPQMQGEVALNDFAMKGGDLGDYELEHLLLTLMPHADGSELRLKSDFADAAVTGEMSAANLMEGVKTVADRALPGLMAPPAHRVRKKWTADLTLRKTDVFRHFVGADVQLQSPLRLRGVLDSGHGRSYLTVSTTGLSVSGNELSRVGVFVEGQGDRYDALLKLQKVIGGAPYRVEANLSTRDSALVAELGWKGETRQRYEGSVATVTRFFHSLTHKADFHTMIRPTTFLLADTVWQVSSGELALRNRDFAIRNVCVSRENQALSVDGRLSAESHDSIVAHLKNIDVSYILGLVNFDAVEFGGLASGTAVFMKKGDTPQLHARLHLPDFRFNKGPMGETDILAEWSAENKRILLDADMRLPRGKGGTQVKGFVDLAQKGLNLGITAQHTDVRFLRRYIDGIFGHFDGDATGFVRLYGPFKKLDFTGDVTANVSGKVLSTGVDYTVTDGSVHLKPGAFEFSDFKVKDRKGGRGTASGALRHTHLKKLNYEFDLTADHLLCYDVPKQHDLPFYSTTVGTGNVHLQGWPNHFTADILIRPESGTSLVYELGTADAVSTENSMVRFHEARRDDSGNGIVRNEKNVASSTEDDDHANDPGTDILLNFFIDANPQAQVKIVTDPRAGDNLTLYGYGPIRATFHNKGAFEMFGTYNVTRGVYKLSIQDIIRKDLILQEGSRMVFAGDPLGVDLDLKAKYTVNGVSLSDLNYGAGFSQKSVKVDCLLNIGGQARAPQINFDLDLHNISEDEKQMVRQLISTDEDMNRQIIYLLGVGRFYTANASSALSQVSTQQQSSAAMRSFLSTTLTSQLNSAISNVLGSDSHWSFGANVAPGTYGWDDIEVDGLLEGRLFNDRLLINGNFGYRDRPTYASNFVGDFDIRYLLTPKGSVSLRAYSETTDRYFTKNSLTTQGVGLMLQRDFKKFKDLFIPNRKKRKPLPSLAPVK